VPFRPFTLLLNAGITLERLSPNLIILCGRLTIFGGETPEVVFEQYKMVIDFVKSARGNILYI